MNAIKNTLVEVCKLPEGSPRNIEVSELTRLAVVDDLDGDHLAVVVEVDSLATLAVSAVLLDGSDHRVVGGGWATAGRVIELAAAVPGDFAVLADPVTLLSVTSLYLVRSLAKNLETGFVSVDGSGRDGHCGREEGEDGGSELHCVRMCGGRRISTTR